VNTKINPIPQAVRVPVQTGDATLHLGALLYPGTLGASSTSSGCDLTNTRYVLTHHLVWTVNPIQSLPRLRNWTVPAATACSFKQAYLAPVSRPRVREQDTTYIDNNAIDTSIPSNPHNCSRSLNTSYRSSINSRHCDANDVHTSRSNTICAVRSNSRLQSVGLGIPGRGYFIKFMCMSYFSLLNYRKIITHINVHVHLFVLVLPYQVILNYYPILI
jgi:hypothetical protein